MKYYCIRPGEAMPEQVRSAECPSAPQANGLSDLLSIIAHQPCYEGIDQ